MISFLLFRPQSGEIFDLKVNYHPNYKKAAFEINGLSAVISAEMLQLSSADLVMENLFVYPNPSNGTFNIGGFYGKINIEISDPQGSLIENLDIELPGKLNLTNFTPGLYFLRIKNFDVQLLRRVVIR